MEHVESAELIAVYRSLLFSRIVPLIRDIGLWSENVRDAYAEMGVLHHVKADLLALMRQDEDIAEQYDEERAAAEELAIREAEVAEAVELGSE
jgi:hypothetical protein